MNTLNKYSVIQLRFRKYTIATEINTAYFQFSRTYGGMFGSEIKVYENKNTKEELHIYPTGSVESKYNDNFCWIGNIEEWKENAIITATIK